jgi:hypothetical protein
MTVGYDAGDRHRHTPQFARVRRHTAAVGRGDRSRFTRTAGVIATEMAAAVPDKVIEKFKKQIRVGRLGPRGNRTRGALSRRRRLGLHHRPALGRQRRNGYVTRNPAKRRTS